jgi:hypothetical protein
MEPFYHIAAQDFSLFIKNMSGGSKKSSSIRKDSRITLVQARAINPDKTEKYSSQPSQL